jgi:hypothetical protein
VLAARLGARRRSSDQNRCSGRPTRGHPARLGSRNPTFCSKSVSPGLLINRNARFQIGGCSVLHAEIESALRRRLPGHSDTNGGRSRFQRQTAGDLPCTRCNDEAGANLSEYRMMASRIWQRASVSTRTAFRTARKTLRL